jgi:plasmid stabilization system protein ParE
LSYRGRFTRTARKDLVRLYRFLLERDVDAAARALDTIRQGIEVLRTFPFTARPTRTIRSCAN